MNEKPYIMNENNLLLLNLPEYNFKIIKDENNTYIFDELRKKNVVLTPEEWVRQNFVKYLINELNYPKGLMSLEYPFSMNKTNKRSDIVIFNKDNNVIAIVECKAPNVKLDAKSFEQIAIYNLHLKTNILILTNGLLHFCWYIDHEKNVKKFLKRIPRYDEIIDDSFYL